MSNVIDSFLVALGFEVDDKSAKKSKDAINDIRTGALQMGAALSAAFVGVDLQARKTAGEIDSVNNAAKLLGSVGVTELDKYRHAFVLAGGSGEEAAATFSAFEGLLANARLGQGPFEELAKAGLPADLLIDTKTSIQLFEKLAALYPRLSDEQKKLAGSALGLGGGADLLLRRGSGQLSEWLADAEKYGVLTQGMADNTEKLVDSTHRLERAWDSLWNNFSASAAPGMADAEQMLADFLVSLQGPAGDLGGLFGDKYDILAPTAWAGTAAATTAAAGAIATKAGMTTVGGALTATGSAFVPAALLAGSGYLGYKVGELGQDYVANPLVKQFSDEETLGGLIYSLTHDESSLFKPVPARGGDMTINAPIKIIEADKGADVGKQVEDHLTNAARQATETLRTNTAG